MIGSFGLLAALLASGSMASVIGPYRVDECTCTQQGNTYTAVSADGCHSFVQSTRYHKPTAISCPGGHVFDVTSCTCAYPDAAVTCPAHCQGAVTPVHMSRDKISCTVQGNVYALQPGSGCTTFTQLALNGAGQVRRHSCPTGLIFDVDICTCNRRSPANCPLN